MSRTALAAVLLLAGAFGVVVALKQRRPAPQEEITAVDEARRERVRRFWDVYRQAGQARREGDDAAAVELYQAALALQPDHEDSLYYLGNCAYELGRYQEARAAYDRLIEVSPQGSSRGYMRLGLVYASREPGAPVDLPRAEEVLRRALRTDPDSGALLNLGEVALLQGRWEQARQALSDFNADNAMHPGAPYLLGFLAWRQGDREKAREWFRTAVGRLETKKPPVPWSEEGDVKASPELRWQALARQSVLGEHWLRLRQYLEEQAVSLATIDGEYRRLREKLGGRAE